MPTTPDALSFQPIFDALSLHALTSAEQAEILADLNSLVFRGSLVRLIEKMNDKTRRAFGELMESNVSLDEIQSFLDIHAPDADSAVAETIAFLTDDILALSRVPA